jgi:hypothetical protein
MEVEIRKTMCGPAEEIRIHGTGQALPKEFLRTGGGE